MKLEFNKEYLISSIQKDWGYYTKQITTIKVIRETEKAFQIEQDNGGKFWFLKEWDVSILEEISFTPNMSDFFNNQNK